MPGPPEPPLGLYLTRSARIVERAFDEALALVGASAPVWQTLLAVRAGRGRSQRELAAAIGVHGATLTHHLNGLEQRGLLVRRRQPGNRRQHEVELTDAGVELFQACRQAAAGFDRRLRSELTAQQLADFVDVLDRLRRNAAPDAATPSGPLG